jgi:hypothetical protein
VALRLGATPKIMIPRNIEDMLKSILENEHGGVKVVVSLSDIASKKKKIIFVGLS